MVQDLPRPVESYSADKEICFYGIQMLTTYFTKYRWNITICRLSVIASSTYSQWSSILSM